MQTYEIKRGHFKEIEGAKLLQLAKDVFGKASQEGEAVISSFGALESLRVWTDGNSLHVDTVTRRDVEESVAADTIRAYNRFLEMATGFTSKQRRDRLQKKAKEGNL